MNFDELPIQETFTWNTEVLFIFFESRNEPIVRAQPTTYKCAPFKATNSMRFGAFIYMNKWKIPSPAVISADIQKNELEKH